LLDGVDIGQLDDDARADLRGRKLGFIFQFHFLLPELSALENVMLPALRQRLSASLARTRALELLELVGLQGLAGRSPGQLSGGQQQRVAIARALINGPRLLLADEPTGSLDRASGELVMDLIESLARRQGLATVLVTHEPVFAERGSRRIELEDGRVVSVL
jgi:ABC-type lipoprotein export system ATPase subunit